MRHVLANGDQKLRGPQIEKWSDTNLPRCAAISCKHAWSASASSSCWSQCLDFSEFPLKLWGIEDLIAPKMEGPFGLSCFWRFICFFKAVLGYTALYTVAPSRQLSQGSCWAPRTGPQDLESAFLSWQGWQKMAQGHILYIPRHPCTSPRSRNLIDLAASGLCISRRASKGDRLAIFFLEENHHIVEEGLFTGLLFLKLLLQQSALCSKLPLAPLRRLP